eukprot:scaffold15090_cov50-Cyclotella_meneghiniana.AAC.7
MLVGLGLRRTSTRELSTGPTSSNNNPGGGLARRASVKLSPAQTASVAGNVMHNVFSTPLSNIDLSYSPPSFAKSEKDAEFISLALQRNFVFANALSDEDHARRREERLIVDAFEPYSCIKGDVILKDDTVGDYFYILKEGIVDYITGGKVVRSAKRPGQSFGELCLLYDCPPPTNCVGGGGTSGGGTANKVKLWRLNKNTFRQIMALTSIRKDETLRNALKKVRHLEGLDDEFINRIADSLDVKSVPKGTVLYKDGDAADAFYLIEYDGKVEVKPKGGKSEVLGPGDAFGEEAIGGKQQQHIVRSETVKTLAKTTVFSMKIDALNRVIGNLDDAIQLSQDRKLLKSVPVFRDSDLEGYEFELLAALIERVTFKGGKEIMLEDEMVESPALYLVYDGVLEMESEQFPGREKALKKGDYFGDMTLMPDKNMKFGGKGGNKYYEESVIVLSDTAVCGKLTLANIDSVVLDLHRLGCNMPGQKKYASSKSMAKSTRLLEDPPESLNDLKYHQLFGAGTFGRVYCVTKKGGKTAYALKIQSKRELLDQRQASSAVRERGVMVKLDHPFVCKLVASYQDDACIYMLLTLIQGGELLNIIQGGILPESAAKFYAASIAEGLTYMHRRHIIYRDLKPENAKSVTDKTYTFCGTPLYLAPEIVLSKGHDRAVDYWSLGCLIYEMLFGSTPFYERGIDQKGLFRNIVRGNWSIPKKAKVGDNAISMISGMLERKPTERLGCLAGGYRDIKNHPWMKEVNFVKLVMKQIKAPWTPQIDDPTDLSNFDNFDGSENDLKGKKPLTAEEQLVFKDF